MSKPPVRFGFGFAFAFALTFLILGSQIEYLPKANAASIPLG